MYGDLVRISDLAELTARQDIVGRALYMLGQQVAEVYDQLIFNTIDGATNEYRPNNKTSDTGLTAADTVGYTDLISNLASLQSKGGRPIQGSDYVFVCSPFVHASLLKDPDWVFRSYRSKYLGTPNRFPKGYKSYGNQRQASICPLFSRAF